jgi:hypothetical protein
MQVPQRLGNAWDDALLRVFAQGRFVQEENVNVGTGKQRTTAVTTQGSNANPVG